MSKAREHYEIIYNLRLAEAQLAYALDVFGDMLNHNGEVPIDLDGIEAIDYYLVRKFSWKPSDVRSMSAEDKRFALTEEMKGFTYPKEAVFDWK